MRRLLKYQAILFPVLDIALNGANYLFHLYVAWHLIPTDYGIANALLSLSALMLVTGVSLQIYTARQVALDAGTGGVGVAERVSEIRRTATLVVAGVSILYVVALLPLHGVTRGNYPSLLILLVIFGLNAYLSINRGVIQGTKRFIHLNLSFYLEVGVKLVVVFFLLRSFPTTDAVLLPIAAGMAVALAHSSAITRNWHGRHRQAGRSWHVQTHLARILRTFAANFFTYFFTSIDILIVNYFLPDESGYFAVVLKYTQILLFATLSVTTVFIPSLSGARGDPHLFTRKLWTLLGLVSAITLAVIGVYAVLAAPTVDWFFGPQYASAKQYILFDCLPYSLLILNFLLINVHIVLDNRRYLLVLPLHAVALTALLIAFHQSLTLMLWIETGVFASMLVFQLLLLRGEVRRPGTITEPVLENR